MNAYPTAKVVAGWRIDADPSNHIALTFITDRGDINVNLSRKLAVRTIQRLVEFLECPAESSPRPSGSVPEPLSPPAPTTQPSPGPST